MTTNWTQRERDELAKRIEACESVRESARQREIVLRLPDELKAHIQLDGNPRTWVAQALSVCFRYPEGIDKLVEAIEYFERGSIAMTDLRLYVASVDNKPSAPEPAEPRQSDTSPCFQAVVDWLRRLVRQVVARWSSWAAD